MVPALLIVLAAWCPTTTTTAPDRPQCNEVTTTTTTPAETTSSVPMLVIPDPDRRPSTPTTATTATTQAATIVDAATENRPVPARRLPVTGPDGHALAAGGFLVFLGGLLVAARPGRAP